MMPKTLIPARLPVLWHTNSDNIVTIEYDKKFTRFESLLSKMLKSPKTLKRPLDNLNSHLWILMDGSNNIGNIISKMDLFFQEEIIPAEGRINKSIITFLDLGLITMINPGEEINWNIKKSVK
ncbi:MAG: hypothetical protein NLN64_03880 [Candidatus Thalassarchaeaceae archaeon]|nr:hypothetical protein [Candidatus Thalassarchaeaceae archaeon]